MIPTTPTDHWFKKLDSLTTHFYWIDKKTRIALSTLQNSKHWGRLEAPNFMYYFLASQLQYLYKWTQQQIHSDPWLDLEQKLCSPNSITDLPLSTIVNQKKWTSIVTSQYLQLWQPGGKPIKSPNHPKHHAGTPPSGTTLTSVCTMHRSTSPNGSKRASPPPSHFWKSRIYAIHLNYPEIWDRGDQFLHYQQLKSLIKYKLN